MVKWNIFILFFPSLLSPALSLSVCIIQIGVDRFVDLWPYLSLPGCLMLLVHMNSKFVGSSTSELTPNKSFLAVLLHFEWKNKINDELLLLLLQLLLLLMMIRMFYLILSLQWIITIIIGTCSSLSLSCSFFLLTIHMLPRPLFSLVRFIIVCHK